MRVPHLLVGAPLAGRAAGDVVSLDGDQEHHLRRVLRRGHGDELTVTDGAGGLATATLVPGGAALTAAPTSVDAPRPRVTVVHALPKGRAFDEVVRTLAELGVARVVPVVTERTESRPTGDAAARVGERWRSIARSALEQAQSAHLCAVDDPAPLSVTERYLQGSGVALVGHPAATTDLGAALPRGASVPALSVLVGPEGGISDTEVEALRDAGWIPVRAGATVLRTVHAGTALVAAAVALAGGYDGA